MSRNESLSIRLFVRLSSLLAIALLAASVGCGASGGDEANDNGEANIEQGAPDQNQNDGENGNPNDDENVNNDGPVCGDGILDVSEQCDDGDDQSGDGCSKICELEAFEADGKIVIDLVLDSLVSNTAPSRDSCPGVIELSLDNGLLQGEGRCFFEVSANLLDYFLEAEIAADGEVEGDIGIVLNGSPHFLAVDGFLDDGVLSLEFDGVTLVTQSIRAVWKGTIEAELD